MKKLFSLLLIVCLFALKGIGQTCPPVNHNPFTDFNPSSNPGTPTTLWLHINTKLNPSGSGSLTHENDFIKFKGGTISLNSVSSTPTVTNVAIPDGMIIATSSVSSPVTTYDPGQNLWTTKVPLSYSSSDIFVTGATIISSTGFGISGGGKSSAISAQWQSNLGGQFASSWFYGLACYQPTFSCSDIATTVTSIGTNGLQAGTPTNELHNLVAGGSGGGGANYTGSNSSTDNFTACQPTCSLGASGTSVNVSCNNANDGSITLTVTGAQGTVSYLWNDGSTSQNRSGLAPGSYSVTVTDGSGCTASASFSITQPDAINVSGLVVNVTHVNGNDGSITLTVTGGTGPYSFLWSDGSTDQNRSGLTAGTYSVTVTDAHSCTSGGSFIVMQPTCSLVVTGKKAGISCSGANDGTINLTVTGAQAGATFLWSDGSTSQNRTGLSPGTYSVTVTDGVGCTASASFIIKQPKILKAVSAKINTSITACTGQATITASGGTAPYTYIWNDGFSGAVRTGLCQGTYTVTVTDSHGCFVVLTIKIGVIPPGTPASYSVSVTSEWSVNAFPNPTNGVVQLSVNSANDDVVTAYLYDMTGRLVLTQSIQVAAGTTSHNIDLSQYPAGVYQLRAVGSDNESLLKIILTK